MSDAGPVYAVLASVLRALWPGTQATFDHVFTWNPGHSPLSTVPSIALTLASYLGVVYGLRAAIDNGHVKPPRPNARYLKAIFVTHNVALSLASGLLLTAMLEEVTPIWRNEGFFPAICAASSYTPRLRQMYLINYYMKFWELLDTVFLVVKRKPLGFLHPYHHTATAFLCYTQLHGHTSVQWVIISLNLAVHTIMYAYYALTTLKIPCPWKRLVTASQIVQFILDVAVIYFAMYNYFVFKYAPYLPNYGNCAGGRWAAFTGCLIINSYLLLFIDFYTRTYKKKTARSQLKAVPEAESKLRSDGLLPKGSVRDQKVAPVPASG